MLILNSSRIRACPPLHDALVFHVRLNPLFVPTPTLSFPQLAALATIFVNDAFGAAHRAHASTVGVTNFMEHSVAGFLMEKELNYLKGTVDAPSRPFMAIIGGAKVSTKVRYSCRGV